VLRVYDSGFTVKGLRFGVGVWGLEFRAQGVRFRVEGLRLRV
jgi:hypothetical protein